jgi:hypothetical protein
MTLKSDLDFAVCAGMTIFADRNHPSKVQYDSLSRLECQGC